MTKKTKWGLPKNIMYVALSAVMTSYLLMIATLSPPNKDNKLQEQQHDKPLVLLSRGGEEVMQLLQVKEDGGAFRTNKTKPLRSDWGVPIPPDPKCPTFCGDKLEFEPFARNNNATLERGIGTRTFFRASRSDYIDPMRNAVEEIDRHGGMDANSYCEAFDSCKDRNKQKSRHSMAYMVCEDYRMVHSSNILVGVAHAKLPGYLGDQGDANIFCKMARFITNVAENTILPSVGLENKKCIVQEFFINQQRTGAQTIVHQHEDDFYGGVFYLDVPERTRLCFEDSEGSKCKQRWYKHGPQFVERLFPDGPGNYPGHVEPRSGDIVLFPVAWAKHWVPKMDFRPDEKRTSVVFNMICL